MVFSGANRVAAENTYHTGIVSFDVDENDAETLRAFFIEIQAGKMPIVEAAARSVSGFATGAMWLNVRVEMPSKLHHIPADLQKNLGLSSATPWHEVVAKLHTAFGEAIKHLTHQQKGINFGSFDLKRMRNLTHDAEIYTNPNAADFGLKSLALFVAERAKELAKVAPVDVDFAETDAFKFARKYADTFHTYDNRQLYISRFSICCNLLGVPMQSAADYVRANFPDYDLQRRDGVRYPYHKYKKTHGVWAYKLAPKGNADTLVLAPGEYLSAKADQITKTIIEKKRVEIKCGMGDGKSYAITRHVAPDLVKLNGCQSLIILPLNSKVEQEAKESGLPHITGEASKGQGGKARKSEAMKAPVILTNQKSAVSILEKFKADGKRVNVFVDECHLLVSGASYKGKDIAALWSLLDSVAETVTLYSGTPKPYFGQLGFYRLNIEKERQRKVNISVRYRDASIEKTALALVSGFDFMASKLVVKIQSKKKIEAIKKALILLGWNSKEIVCLYSEKHVKEGKDYAIFKDATKEKGSFQGGVKLVLCTSFINEGVNIYDADRVTFATIEKRRSFDADDFIQFPERWRNTKDVDFLAYVPRPKDENQESNFRPIDRARRFASLLADWQFEAKKYNETEKSEYVSQERKLDLRTKFSNAEKSLFFDGFAYRVNVVELMNQAEQRHIEGQTIDTVLADLAKLNYFVVSDERTTPELETDAETDSVIQEVGEAMKESAEIAEQTIFELYTNERDVFRQAVGLLTEKQEIKDVIEFDAARRDAVEQMRAIYSDVFTTHFAKAEKVVERIGRLGQYFIEESEALQIIFNSKNKLRSNQAFANFINELRLSIGLLALETTKAMKVKGKGFAALTGLQMADMKLIARIADEIEASTEPDTVDETCKVIAPDVVENIVLNAYTKGKKRKTNMTKKKAMQLFTTLFDVVRVMRSGVWIYTVKGRKTVDGVLAEHLPEFDEKNRNSFWWKNLYNSLEINELPQHNYPINTKKESGSCVVKSPIVCPVFGCEINEFGYPASWG